MKILDRDAPLVDAEVALAEDVGRQVQQVVKRLAILAAVREQGY
jgi:hypothetical protein